jgi:hypothetical protein
MLAMSTPQEGQHQDLYQIQELFNEICELRKNAEINLNGLFLNTDPGFDSMDFRQACQAEGIFPNVKPNPRNSSKTKDEPYKNETHIFDEQFY